MLRRLTPTFVCCLALLIGLLVVFPAAAAPTDTARAVQAADRQSLALQVTETPDATGTPESTETPEPTETPDGTETPEPTETPDDTETPEPTETPDGTETPEPTETPEVTATVVPSPTNPITTSHPVALAISRYFQVPISETLALREIPGMGFGAIARAYFLAEETGVSVWEIAEMRESGLGWGQIAMELVVSPSASRGNLGLIMRSKGNRAETDDPPEVESDEPAPVEQTTTGVETQGNRPSNRQSETPRQQPQNRWEAPQNQQSNRPGGPGDQRMNKPQTPPGQSQQGGGAPPGQMKKDERPSGPPDKGPSQGPGNNGGQKGGKGKGKP